MEWWAEGPRGLIGLAHTTCLRRRRRGQGRNNSHGDYRLRGGVGLINYLRRGKIKKNPMCFVVVVFLLFPYSSGSHTPSDLTPYCPVLRTVRAIFFFITATRNIYDVDDDPSLYFSQTERNRDELPGQRTVATGMGNLPSKRELDCQLRFSVRPDFYRIYNGHVSFPKILKLERGITRSFHYRFGFFNV